MSIWKQLRQEEILRLHGVTVPPPGTFKLQSRQHDIPLTSPPQDSWTQFFTFNLLQEECARAPRQNVFLSPLSVFLGLSMIENGASGQVKIAMRRVLGLPLDATESAVNEFAAGLLNNFRSNGKAEFSIANALWADLDSAFVPEFVENCEKVYGATAQALDFRQPSAATTINQWISEKTQGHISEMIAPSALAKLSAILANAIYFKGIFVERFPPDFTRLKKFQLADGQSKRVQMMMNGGLANSYRCGEGFEVAIRRYENTDVALCMILPAQGKMPQDVLTEDVIHALFKPDEGFQLCLEMPKFTVNFNASLRASLSRLGMGIAFEYPDADFSSLATPDFVLSESVHKTRLEVDEDGTVALAAIYNYGAAGAACAPPVPTKTLIFNRPFAVLLLNTKTRTVVFGGVVYDP